mmetsp:Transcript_12089/g.19834  ORF Transcript_12089/g.19834 Transcript_12089/m.19834 type:complete len:147 (-) Transcript_12089:78-518(-)
MVQGMLKVLIACLCLLASSSQNHDSDQEALRTLLLALQSGAAAPQLRASRSPCMSTNRNKQRPAEIEVVAARRPLMAFFEDEDQMERDNDRLISIFDRIGADDVQEEDGELYHMFEAGTQKKIRKRKESLFKNACVRAEEGCADDA